LTSIIGVLSHLVSPIPILNYLKSSYNPFIAKMVSNFICTTGENEIFSSGLLISPWLLAILYISSPDSILLISENLDF
jgi:hypothetical protein